MGYLVRWNWNYRGEIMGTFPCSSMRVAVRLFNDLWKPEGNVHRLSTLRVEREDGTSVLEGI